MKSSKLIDFLISLGTDPEVVRLYERDRDAAMDAAGLSAKEKALLVRGSQNQLRAAIAAASDPIDVHAPPPPGVPAPPPLPRPEEAPPPNKPEEEPPPSIQEEPPPPSEEDPATGVHSVLRL
jgi:hypothetical protein